MEMGRVLCKVPVATIKDRRVRTLKPTLPPAETEFSEVERAIFLNLDRRLRPLR